VRFDEPDKPVRKHHISLRMDPRYSPVSAPARQKAVIDGTSKCDEHHTGNRSNTSNLCQRHEKDAKRNRQFLAGNRFSLSLD
jgi:hypothetical protein